MNCPMCDADSIESGPNVRVKVELPDKTVKKLVCEDCGRHVEVLLR